jgi:erythromycin esterase-like protein
MFRGSVSSWNLRDRHMAETLERLVDHLDRRVGETRAVVWAHNSHLGDARATAMSEAGEPNLGQLVRERWPEESVLVGFSTFEGTVTAARDWDAPAERRRVRPGLPESWEAVFHQAGGPHYFNARLADQFDALIHLDATTALVPLDRTDRWEWGEAPETYPSGL